MSDYINYVKTQLKDWKVALLTLVFTVARVIYGIAWIQAGEHKLTWFSDGKLDSIGLIKGMVGNLAAAKNDPLGINNLYAWVAQGIFVNTMPSVTDVMVVICEILVGIVLVLGFKVFWSALVAVYMNLQFNAAGSFNNFGYIWSDLAFMKFAKYSELIGVSGYLDFKKQQKKTAQNSVNM
ncbi:DoxX family membrane protein [Desulfitobacterium metallireducens]|uniref:DoxX protein n=1 Tax=Desulfitobacterium metallireducens DSM 15288 TaxID=871968 RepID=W0EBT2_9FIRM|nr:DoxX family membrane protein [Desulfitobacterium metallireducens]AHF08202.1 DoxX protein [Desulfitobacterium metallireducens DSM 15288]